MDDKLPHRKMAEVEMADALIRLLDYAGGFGVKFDSVNHAVRNPPENKGEALFEIIKVVARIADYGNVWIEASILFINAYCSKFGYDLMGAFEEKMAFNATRKDHQHKARLAAGGKKF